MARPLRIAYPGALYHITVRGNEKREIFWSDVDRHHFLRLLAQSIDRFGWICYAYCLMSNHFHLLLETPIANISAGMRHLNGVYTQYFNWLHRRVGHLFQGRFKGILVEKQPHLLELARYVILNPVRAGICSDPKDYVWSSYRATIGLTACPSYLQANKILELFGPPSPEAALQYQRYVMEGIDDRPWDRLQGQIYMGSEAFIKQFQSEKSLKPEIPKIQQQPLPSLLQQPVPPLSELLNQEDGILRAYYTYGYSMREIATRMGRHYSTVSRQLKKLEAL